MKLRTRQTGFVLVMSLVFLLLLTILGVTAMSTTSLEEKMAHNIKDKNLSFHAAESAVRHAEVWLDDFNVKPDPQVQNSSTDGLYDALTNLPAKPFWQSIDWASSSDIVVYPKRPDNTTSGTALFGLADQPRYILELIHGGDCPLETMNTPQYGLKQCQVYRITGHGVGGTNAAVSRVQITYKKAI